MADNHLHHGCICVVCKRIVHQYCEFCGKACPPSPPLMVPVPAGPVVLGTSEEELSVLALATGTNPTVLLREKPQEVVLLEPFYIDRFPVTVGQFYDFARELSPADRKHFRIEDLREPKVEERDLPATQVSWLAAVRFARRYGKRLPTEAEWEKAAGFDPSTHSKRIFPWGNDPGPDNTRCNRSKSLSSVFTHEIDGESALHGCDFVGNAIEWCADPFNEAYEFHAYEDLRIEVAGQSTAGLRAVRGGSCDSALMECRVGWRAGMPGDEPGPLTGFRCAKDAS